MSALCRVQQGSAGCDLRDRKSVFIENFNISASSSSRRLCGSPFKLMNDFIFIKKKTSTDVLKKDQEKCILI